jgi:hypothetical protein
VECKSTWSQKNVFDSETHFHKWGKAQEIKPNVKCTPILGVALIWEFWIFRTLVEKGKQALIWALKIPLEMSWRYIDTYNALNLHLDLKCMSYDQKKSWESNWEFNSWPQILSKVGVKLTPIRVCNTPLKRSFEGYKILPSHASKCHDLRNIWTSKVLK